MTPAQLDALVAAATGRKQAAPTPEVGDTAALAWLATLPVVG